MDVIELIKKQLSTGVVKLVVLSFMTLGIYPIMWLYRYQPVLTKQLNHQFVPVSFPIWLAIVTGVRFYFISLTSPIDPGAGDYQSLALIMYYLLGIMLLVWALRARMALQTYFWKKYQFELKVNLFLTVIFGLFYILYCFNNMPSRLRKHHRAEQLEKLPRY